MGKRIGFYTIRQLAQQMCKYIVLFSPAIRLYYPNNPTLLLSLEAALAACGTLDAEIAAAEEPGV